MPSLFDVELRAPKSVRWVLTTFILAATACSDRNLTTAIPSNVDGADLRAPIASISMDPAVVSRNVGDSGVFLATAKDRYGRKISGVVFSWTVSDPTVVRLHQNGTAAALAPGNVTVTAAAGGKTGVSQVTILGTPVVVVDSVIVSPSYASGNVGDSAVFTAIAKDANGNTLTNRVISWSSSNPAAVTIDAAGMARAVGLGSAQLIATVEGKTGVANADVLPRTVTAPVVVSVQVTPGSASGAVNDSAQFAAAAFDSAGIAITGRTVTWSSTNSAVVVVSATGMGRAVGQGSAQLVATIDGVSGHSDITVLPPPPPTPAPVASVSIAPVSVSVNTGASSQLAATLRDANGNVLTGRSISWSSSNGLVASVGNDGMVTGVVAGSATITATSEGMSGSAGATVTLIPPPPPTGGSWPNMPSTYSVLTDQPFNPLTVLGWQLIWNPVGNGTITTNSTAPFSASSVFQVKYPAGFAAGSAPATQYFPLGGKSEVYVGTWWKANADWQGHESNVNKVQFLTTSDNSNVYMAAYGPPGGPYEIRTAFEFIGMGSGWFVPNVSSGVVAMGQWHRLEWLVQVSTSGANGVVKWWVDGQLVGSYTNVQFPAATIAEYKLSPTFGGMGGTVKQKDDYYWFDHVTIGSR